MRPEKSQIQERLDSGDREGATRLVARGQIQKVKEGLHNQSTAAFEQFITLHPEFAEIESRMNFYVSLMRKTLLAEGRDPATATIGVDDLERLWGKIQGQRVPATEDPNTARPRQVTQTQAPSSASAPAPEPVDEAQAALDDGAKQFVGSKGGVEGFKQFFANLTAKQMEIHMRDLSFQRAVELVFPPAHPSPLTRGDHVHAAQEIRTAEYAGANIAEAEHAVAASREQHAQAFARYQEKAPERDKGGVPHWGGLSFGDRRAAAPAGRKTMTPAEARANEAANLRQRGPQKTLGDVVAESAKTRREEIETSFRR